MRRAARAVIGAAVFGGLGSVSHGQVSISLQSIKDPGATSQVDYVYRMGTYEITNDQYAAFLNAIAATDTYGVYDTRMGSTVTGGITRSGSSGSYTYVVKANFGDKPVYYLTWPDAARFVNWMENRQPTGAQGPGTTEDGTYELSGDDEDDYYDHIGRASGAKWFLPTREEFHKAAYWDESKSKFWIYATRSDSAPSGSTATSLGDIEYPGANVVNYNQRANWNFSSKGNVTTVGSCHAPSYYGTYDQNGNAQEWWESDDSRGLCRGKMRAFGMFATEPPLNLVVSFVALIRHSGQAGVCQIGLPIPDEVGMRIARVCAADINRDGQVDAEDESLFDTYLENEDVRADVNDDLTVDFVDYLEFRNAYADGC